MSSFLGQQFYRSTLYFSHYTMRTPLFVQLSITLAWIRVQEFYALQWMKMSLLIPSSLESKFNLYTHKNFDVEQE